MSIRGAGELEVVAAAGLALADLADDGVLVGRVVGGQVGQRGSAASRSATHPGLVVGQGAAARRQRRELLALLGRWARP